MTLEGSYDDNNIFAKILRGDLPKHSVFEDDVALSFLDLHPQTHGHTLVIPKTVKARNLLDFPAEHLGAYMQRVQRVAIGLKHALSPDGLTVMQFNGAPAGQTIFHVHFHILPRWEGDAPSRHGGAEEGGDELAELAAHIAKYV
jgi:histidine triad (HIT) family protein